jgi:hypothetical protein
MGVCKQARIDITEESKISFLRSVKLLMAPLDVCMTLHDLSRSFQSMSDPSIFSSLEGSLI